MKREAGSGLASFRISGEPGEMGFMECLANRQLLRQHGIVHIEGAIGEHPVVQPMKDRLSSPGIATFQVRENKGKRLF